MKHFVFAIVGMPGAGKSVVASLFAEKGMPVVRFGDVTEEELQRRGLAQSPETERAVREEIRASEGMDAYAKRNAPRMDAALVSGHVAADGLYSWAEYKHLKAYYGDRLRVIAVIAAPAIRYDRLRLRPVRSHSPEASFARDMAEIEHVQKAGPIAMSDFTLPNEGSMEDLRAAFETMWPKLVVE